MAKRRPSGDGMVRKREDGRWEGRIVVGHKADGDSIFRYIYADTQKELTAKLRQNIDLYQGIDLTEQSRMILAEWLEQWLEQMSATLRPSTLEHYQKDMKNHVAPHLGQKELTQITAADLRKLYDTLKKNGRINPRPGQIHGLSSTTVHNIHATLHQALRAAAEQGLIPKNPADEVAPPKIIRQPMNILNEEQLDTFMGAIEADPVWHDFFYTELTTGMRRGELLALQWSDLDFKTDRLHISKQVYSVNGKLEVNEPKTKAAVRTVILPPAMVELLAEYKAQVFSEWMFPSRIKPEQPVDPGYVRKRLQVILERAGCKRVRFHDLRHTFATMSLENGMDVKTLSTIIGHVSSATTLNIYTHITGEMQRNAARNIDQGIAGVEVQEQGEVEQEEAVPPVEFTPYRPPHRRPGTGCISQINDHLWEGRYSPKWIDGKKHARNIYAHTREECEEKLAALIVQMKRELAELKAAQAAGAPFRH